MQMNGWIKTAKIDLTSLASSHAVTGLGRPAEIRKRAEIQRELFKTKKGDYAKIQEKKILDYTEAAAFQTLRTRWPTLPKVVPMDTWENYFKSTLNKRQTKAAFISIMPQLSV
jgi:hypothetical protein